VANPAKTLALTILEKEYRVNCPDGAEEKLRDAARLLNDKMLEIKNASASSGKILPLDRIAVIAALNLAHQLRELEGQSGSSEKDLRYLHRILDDTLAQDQQLELP
jgi:cell division protein ZapA